MIIKPYPSRLVKHSPVYYGWVVWFTGMLGLAATSPGQSFSVSLFIDHYIQDFGLDRATISALYGLGTFIAALSLTFVGTRIDRYGNRRMGMLIALLFGLVLMACSLIMGPITILMSFIAIRGLGQGSMGLNSTTSVAQWFHRRRGWVIGLALVGFALFQRIYLPWLQAYIEDYGWRQAWLLLGAVMLVGVLPIFAMLIRDRPEQFGLVPDGKLNPVSSEATDVFIEENWQLNEVMRTPMFWVFVAARLLVGALATALVFHQISIFDTLGHAASVAASTYGQAAIMTAICTLFFGWWVDRLRPSYMIALQMLSLSAAIGLATLMTSSGLLFLYTLAFGITMGVGSVFDGTVWVNLFGRENQGAIRGFVTTAIVTGTAIGPLVFGLSYDHLGGYTPAIWLGIVIAITIMIAALIVKKPTHPSSAH